MDYNDFMKYNREIYDGIRKFCLTEGVNEEHMRTVVKRPDYFSKFTNALMRVL